MKKRILVVDDDPGIARLLLRLLSRDYDLIVSDSGKDVLPAYQKHKPHLVLLDIKLPDTCGIEILKSLLARDPKALVIMLSGNVHLRVARETMKLGAVEYICKPFDFDHLKELIRSTLEQSRPNRADAGP
ncbi:MAG TPA: two-component system response regulator [Elusimicrobia bacterium]|nr:two-component system response regulator [Elusimicrobiota bacterium]HBT62582.1 two-component system response regulator [Elusimicrobiota bacterium]